jgi:hypothetical protein
VPSFRVPSCGVGDRPIGWSFNLACYVEIAEPLGASAAATFFWRMGRFSPALHKDNIARIDPKSRFWGLLRTAGSVTQYPESTNNCSGAVAIKSARTDRRRLSPSTTRSAVLHLRTISLGQAPGKTISSDNGELHHDEPCSASRPNSDCRSDHSHSRSIRTNRSRAVESCCHR